MSLVNSGVTEPSSQNCLHDVARSSSLLSRHQHWDNSIPISFGMLQRRMKFSRPISPILPLKLVAMTTSLQWSQKNEWLIKPFHASANPEHLVKISPVDWDYNVRNGPLKIYIEKTLAEHIARCIGMPSVVKYSWLYPNFNTPAGIRQNLWWEN